MPQWASSIRVPTFDWRPMTMTHLEDASISPPTIIEFRATGRFEDGCEIYEEV
jgi:hypothetical protein